MMQTDRNYLKLNTFVGKVVSKLKGNEGDVKFLVYSFQSVYLVPNIYQALCPFVGFPKPERQTRFPPSTRFENRL